VTAARRALALFVEPQDGRERAAVLDVGVTGLSRGCGTSTVARGLALELPAARIEEGQGPGAGCVLVVVAGPDAVPILAEMVTDRLRERLPHVVLVANRPDDPQEWDARAVCLPQSRLGVHLISRGRRPWGRFRAGLRDVAQAVRDGPP
jgi:hypothetical protein